MNRKEMIKGELMELLNEYYNDSFSRMVCDYTHTTGMTEEEVEDLLETMKKAVKNNKEKTES